MRLSLTAFAVALTAAPLVAQSGNLVLDADGNYVPSYHVGVRGGLGPDAPGDLLRTYAISNGSTLSGFAPRFQDGGLTNNDGGQWCNLSGGNAEMFGTDFSGLVQTTVPLTDVNDSWPGFDGTRNTIICVNAFDDTISGFDSASGAPLFRVPTPTAGPVGAAYDSFKDIYWYSDWTTNELVGLDATDLHSGVATVADSFSVAAQLTRIAGVAYNCLDDTLTTGGRDQGLQVVYEARSPHNVLCRWPVLGGSVNDPQGCGLSAESGITTTDFNDLNTRVHEGCAGVRPGITAIRTSPGTIRAWYTNYASNETRCIFGWSNNTGPTTIKGVRTCLGLPARRIGVFPLSGTPPRSGSLGFSGISGSPVYLQGANLPSKLVSNVLNFR